ncbi:hypothetical protein ACPXB3_16405 [Gordonia sp. DT219]|uniref:hypothetical protein n=1 Tax=Gordonia sp. DT219 TaxID=3416658 RepID=UPI003CF2267A
MLQLLGREHSPIPVVEVDRDQWSQIARHLAPPVGANDVHAVPSNDETGPTLAMRMGLVSVQVLDLVCGEESEVPVVEGDGDPAALG